MVHVKTGVTYPEFFYEYFEIGKNDCFRVIAFFVQIATLRWAIFI